MVRFLSDSTVENEISQIMFSPVFGLQANPTNKTPKLQNSPSTAQPTHKKSKVPHKIAILSRHSPLTRVAASNTIATIHVLDMLTNLPKQTNALPLHRLSPKEIQIIRSHGLCFHFLETFLLNRMCPPKFVFLQSESEPPWKPHDTSALGDAKPRKVAGDRIGKIKAVFSRIGVSRLSSLSTIRKNCGGLHLVWGCFGGVVMSGGLVVVEADGVEDKIGVGVNDNGGVRFWFWRSPEIKQLSKVSEGRPMTQLLNLSNSVWFGLSGISGHECGELLLWMPMLLQWVEDHVWEHDGRLMKAPVDILNNGEGTSQRGGQRNYGRLTKVEFPKFSGEDVQGWLYKVHQFFVTDGIQDDAQKIILTEIKERFDSIHEDPMVELKNLKQVTSVQLYQDLFEALLNKIERPEAYAINLFIGGLKEETGLDVRMFKPIKLTYVYCFSKMQEATLAVSKSRYSSGYKCSGQMYYLEVIACDELIKDENYVLTEQGVVSALDNEEETMPHISLMQWLVGKHMSSSLSQMGAETFSMAMCVYPVTLMSVTGENSQPKPQIQTLLNGYASVFDTPKEL
ncbi:hypothetical protein Tco_1393755 [Tanacetum coccineum]